MSKYQRPVCILTKVTDEKGVSYQGSARGCDLAGISNFKDICEQTGLTLYQTGHQGAFGLGLAEANIDAFLAATDALLQDMSEEPVYYVDYAYENGDFVSQSILDIAYLDELWGKDMDEPYIALTNLRVKKEMVTVYAKKDLTLKITLPNRTSIIMFKAPEDLCHKLQNENPGYYTMNIVARCAANNYNGYVYPQLKIKDWEITGQVAYCF